MSYATISTMTHDGDLRERVTACSAQESKPWSTITNPLYFYLLASSPGWAAAYESALANSVARPGWNEAVITDGMILSAVQATHL